MKQDDKEEILDVWSIGLRLNAVFIFIIWVFMSVDVDRKYWTLPFSERFTDEQILTGFVAFFVMNLFFYLLLLRKKL